MSIRPKGDSKLLIRLTNLGTEQATIDIESVALALWDDVNSSSTANVSIQEVSLSANQPLGDMIAKTWHPTNKPDDSLGPQAIRSFIVKFEE